MVAGEPRTHEIGEAPTGADAKRIVLVDLAAQRRRLGRRLDDAMQRVLDHAHFIGGPEVGEFERRLAQWLGVRRVVSCANGTDALTLMVRALGIGPGDAVIVPAFTFAATAGAVVLNGAAPVFCDVDPRSSLIDLDAIEPAVRLARRQGLRPRAVIAVDLYGHPVDYARLAGIADASKIIVLADAAQSLGATRNGRFAVRYPRSASTSFFPAKPLGCYGDGGAVITDDAELAELIDSVKGHGRGTDKYDNVRVGTNSRLDTLQAAVLLAKLELFESEMAMRRKIAARYLERLRGRIEVPEATEGGVSTWCYFPIVTRHREAVSAALAAQGIETGIHYPRPLHTQSAFAGYPRVAERLPVAERFAACVLSLPMHAYLDEASQDRVCAAVLNALGATAG
jgi:dTDP-4-amino-4,6-dideoxygalactose transaminase